MFFVWVSLPPPARITASLNPNLHKILYLRWKCGSALVLLPQLGNIRWIVAISPGNSTADHPSPWTSFSRFMGSSLQFFLWGAAVKGKRPRKPSVRAMILVMK